MLLFLVFFKIFLLCNYVSADDRAITFYTEGMQKLCSFKTELAVTPEEHERGLMYRKSLAPDAGMLFVFKEDNVRFFWMKNTYVPLDMVFISSRLEVTGIYRSAKPLDEATLTSWSPAMYVLEINSGKADKCNIRVGSKIKFKNY
ncbi:MAG: DUF192 domain-containing protein [Proteobacteria bacterium]|nr:DUF192 domain-containing protein [Pseudomonadota bacterium]